MLLLKQIAHLGFPSEGYRNFSPLQVEQIIGIMRFLIKVHIPSQDEACANYPYLYLLQNVNIKWERHQYQVRKAETMLVVKYVIST